ncbi:hypothetical protein OAS47_03025 [Pelagibacteraceae bacterium]|nr:hypothetical protein [Pelagibacteraceae bacterium]
MKLLNLSKYFYFIIYLFIFIAHSQSEDSVDIWKKEKVIKKESENKLTNEKNAKILLEKKNIDIFSEKLKIIETTDPTSVTETLYGIYDPEKNNLDLNMWSKSNGDEIKRVIKRINKMKLSKTAESIFINILMTHSYIPKNISETEFLDLKINWLINNKKDLVLEEFLNKNKNFKNKEKIIQYFVNKSIADANLNEGCKKSQFINKEIKDAYLEKFKIYCLIFNDKKNEAQLIYDILKEQELSDTFFDDKINYLLGINKKTSQKIKDNNLLNFYLSSITISDFKYEPDEKTDKFIWEYLNSANLLKINDFTNKIKIKKLEFAANKNTLDKYKIFDIYKKVPFELNSLINAENIYQSLDGIESRSLIYQKFLLSDNEENKIDLLILLKDLFKKDNLLNVYTGFMSDRLKEIDRDFIAEDYALILEKNIISEEEYKLGKIKFDDKILHKSRIIKHYVEQNLSKEKTQKNINNVYKKIKKNKKYFFSAKDLVLIESLLVDGFKIPKEIKYKDLSKKYSIPDNLLALVKNKELGLLSLKFVEIIGEDEVYSLDPETVYFITHILNQANLLNFRNKILIRALPLRI